MSINQKVTKFFSALDAEERAIVIHRMSPAPTELSFISERGMPASGYSVVWQPYLSGSFEISKDAKRALINGDMTGWSNQISVSAEDCISVAVVAKSWGFTADYPPTYHEVHVYLWGEKADEYEDRINKILARRAVDREINPQFELWINFDKHSNYTQGFCPQKSEDGQPFAKARAVDVQGNLLDIPDENINWKRVEWGWMTSSSIIAQQPYFLVAVKNPFPGTKVQLLVNEFDGYAHSNLCLCDDHRRVISPFLKSVTRAVWLSQDGEVFDAALPWLKPVVGPKVNEYHEDQPTMWVKAADLAKALNIAPLDLWQYHSVGGFGWDVYFPTWNGLAANWLGVDEQGSMPRAITLRGITYPKDKKIIGERRKRQGNFYVPLRFAEDLWRWFSRWPGIKPYRFDGGQIWNCCELLPEGVPFSDLPGDTEVWQDLEKGNIED